MLSTELLAIARHVVMLSRSEASLRRSGRAEEILRSAQDDRRAAWLTVLVW